MTSWSVRQGKKVPHHVYRDRRPRPDGDKPVAFFADPELARFAVEAVNEKLDRQASDMSSFS